MGVAYLTKEPVLFIAPALMIDAMVARRWRLLLAITVGMLMIAGAEHTYYKAVTGDLMFRPHAMVQHNHSVAAVEANQYLGRRLFEAYPQMMILPTWSFGLHSVFAILLAIPACFLLSVEKWRLPVLWALLPLIYLNFGHPAYFLLGAAGGAALSVIHLSAAVHAVCRGAHSDQFAATACRSISRGGIFTRSCHWILLWICRPRTRLANRCD